MVPQPASIIANLTKKDIQKLQAEAYQADATGKDSQGGKSARTKKKIAFWNSESGVKLRFSRIPGSHVPEPGARRTCPVCGGRTHTQCQLCRVPICGRRKAEAGGTGEMKELCFYKFHREEVLEYYDPMVPVIPMNAKKSKMKLMTQEEVEELQEAALAYLLPISNVVGTGLNARKTGAKRLDFWNSKQGQKLRFAYVKEGHKSGMGTRRTCTVCGGRTKTHCRVCKTSLCGRRKKSDDTGELNELCFSVFHREATLTTSSGTNPAPVMKPTKSPASAPGPKKQMLKSKVVAQLQAAAIEAKATSSGGKSAGVVRRKIAFWNGPQGGKLRLSSTPGGHISQPSTRKMCMICGGNTKSQCGTCQVPVCKSVKCFGSFHNVTVLQVPTPNNADGDDDQGLNATPPTGKKRPVVSPSLAVKATPIKKQKRVTKITV